MDEQTSVMSSGGFPLGLDWSQNPESIPDGALVQAEQCEYDYADGSLRTVAGVSIVLNAGMSVDTLFYDSKNGVFYFSSGTKLYRSADLTSYTLLGSIVGLSKPVYCLFGSVCLLASGAQLQAVVNGSTLQTVSGSPAVCNHVSVMFGRVRVATDTDQFAYSAIGDYTSWTNNPSDKSSAQYVNVGYKDPGKIIAVDYLPRVTMVYKEGGRAYKIVGEPQDASFAVETVSQTASVLSKFGTVNVDNRSYILGRGGLMSFAPTQDYGNVAPFESGLNINAWIAQNVDANSQIWHVQSKKQLWIKTQNDKRVYLYHYQPRYPDGRGAFTTRTFSNQLNDVCCVGNVVYVAYGNKIGKLDSTLDTDDGVQIQTVIKGANRISTKRSRLIMTKRMVVRNIISGYGTVQFGKRTENLTFSASSPKLYGNKAKLYGNKTKLTSSAYTKYFKVGGWLNKTAQVIIIVQKGAIAIRQLDYEYLDV